MDFLVLFADADTLPLLSAIHESGRHRVVGWYDAEEVGERLASWFPEGESRGSLADSSPTIGNATVIVGGSGTEAIRDGVLRELARGGVPLVLVHPACSAILAFELDMVQRDTGALMLPLSAAALHPAAAQLAGWVADPDASPVGKVEQIVIERAVRDRDDQAVRTALARDALLLRRLVGDFEQVGAMQASEGVGSLANLSVHLTGSSQLLVRWSIGPVVDHAGATLSLRGTLGRLTLGMPETGDWTVESSVALPPADYSEHDASTALITHLESACGGAEVRPNWEDACRATDVAELASEAVRRGKTLSVHNERLTEEDTFKSMMAAGGCLLLTLTLCLLLAVVLVEALELPIRNTAVWRVWPLSLLVFFACFLALQLLRLLFPKQRPR